MNGFDHADGTIFDLKKHFSKVNSNDADRKKHKAADQPNRSEHDPPMLGSAMDDVIHQEVGT